MKTLTSFFLIFFCVNLCAQVDCSDVLQVAPTATQLNSNRDLIQNVDGTFTIVEANLSLLKAEAIVEELQASLDQTGNENPRNAAIRLVLSCMIENELLD